jgi:dihydrofolate synthase/folylpolyglutamate synthase
VVALRALGHGSEACEAAVARAEWPARMQRLRRGPLAEAAPGVELWLDGGHNPAGGQAIAATLAAMPARPTQAICGMLNTKDVGAYMRALAPQISRLIAVSIPDAQATLPAETTAAAAAAAGIPSEAAPTVGDALARIAAAAPGARVLICGSLYLAGTVLRDNG